MFAKWAMQNNLDALSATHIKLKNKMKIIQLEKVRFVKLNESVAANASKLFCMAHLANIESFLYHSNLSF